MADALDRLTSAGLLALGEEDPESCGARRVTVTDTGCVRYVALCQVHNPKWRAAVNTPRRWACSPHDQRSHLLAERGTDQVDLPGAECEQRSLGVRRGVVQLPLTSVDPVTGPSPEQAQYTQLGGVPRPTGVRVPDPQFSTTRPRLAAG